MPNDETFTAERLQHLLSVNDEAGEGTPPCALPAELSSAPSASLFILSRRALSGLVRTEAEKALAARLRDDDAPEARLPADVVKSGELPPELATARHFYKFLDDDQWLLTTRSGIKVAAFASEADLDRWWRGLKRQRGRILTRVRKGHVSGS